MTIIGYISHQIFEIIFVFAGAGSTKQTGKTDRIDNKNTKYTKEQESFAIAKMTARCALYMGTCPEIFESP